MNRIVEETPKISVNKLGEYIVASPLRQRRILEQLKYPEESKYGSTAHYDARKAIIRYLCSGFKDKAINLCIKKLEKAVPKSEYQKNMFLASIEALNNVLNSDSIDKNLSFAAYNGDNPKIEINGVSISVNPDVVVLSSNRNGISFGALKIHLSKSFTLTEESSKYVAALLYYFMDNTSCHGITHPLKASNCISYDAFTDRAIVCPNSTKRRIGDIEACCANIASIWDGI